MNSGAWGEAQAAAYLQQNGYTVLARNYRVRYGEIDLITEDEYFLLFVEVKTRKNDAFARACEHVSAEKQRKLIAAAQCWLQENKTERQPRFDVIEVYGTPETGVRQLNHLKNAFEG